MNRRSEQQQLLRLVTAVRGGESRALVVHGDAGVGKTALLNFMVSQATGFRILRIAGVQPEMELAFAGLQQLCAPILNRSGSLPLPQQEALRVAFGLSEGPAPDRFLVGLAVLSLLSEAAAEGPLLCVVDDQQWLDQASAHALGFTARRLAADSIGLVFSTRTVGEELAGIPELLLAGLPAPEARLLLESTLGGPLDERVRDQIVRETGGNPLALLELLRGVTQAQLAGGFGLPAVVSVSGRIEDSFAQQLGALPPQTQRLLQLAAADPSGDAELVWRAARQLGIPLQAATPAFEAGLAEISTWVWFRHPLLRSAAYRSTSLPERQAMHLALMEATDPAADPDRRAWHRAQGTEGQDEEVAADLERSAGRAQARGGPAAAAAFLEKAVLLTADPVRHAQRLLAAAQANLQAGAFEHAQQLVAAAEALPLEEMLSVQAAVLRGHIAFASGMGSDAPPLLLAAARRLEPLNLDMARETYLTAWLAAVFAGRLATTGNLIEVCQAARELPWSQQPGRAELALDAVTLLVTSGPVAAAQVMRAAVAAFSAADVPPADHLRLGVCAQGAAIALWDMDAWRTLVERHAAIVRTVGALDQLPVVLVGLGTATTWAGDFAASAALIAEADAVCAATGTQAPPFAALMLPALRGDETSAIALIEATITAATTGGQGLTVGYANWVSAILFNGLGRYAEALAAAQKASQDVHGALFVSLWALPELIEAAVRSGSADLTVGPMANLAESARAGGTEFGLGIEARSRALLSDGETADGLYREAIDRLSRTQYRPELGRAHLLYGEWLRQEGRRAEARIQLHTAHGMLSAIGMEAFAERARRELQATGERVLKHTAETVSTLTDQEALIARLARDGQTNSEIAAQLFISARTVEWHMGKIFAKLGIVSRRELQQALDKLPA